MYYEFAEMDVRRVSDRDETVKVLNFPYGEYRKGQRDLAVSVYAAIKNGKKIFAQAPTGTGKTISAIFPAAKALGEGLCAKVFYATAKTITRQIAEEALLHMTRDGLRMRSVTLTAKDKICFCETRRCNPQDCTYAAGHLDRVNAAIKDVIKHEHIIIRQTIEAYAQKHRVCPFELSLDVTQFCDFVICDYNHIYDPRAQLKRFFGNAKTNFVVLNDEAHNLVDRARDMFSAVLKKSMLTDAAHALPARSAIRRSTNKIAKYFSELKKERLTNAAVVTDKAKPEGLYKLLPDFITKCDAWLQENHGAEGEGFETVMQVYFGVLDFVRIYELFDERYVTFYEGGGDVTVKLFCLDPSFLLGATHKKVRSSVFFSATLAPLPYFRTILGGADDDFVLRLMSPFPRENMCLLIEPTIPTRYRDREAGYARIADAISAVAAPKKGNYLVFFPSYEYMNVVVAAFTAQYPDTDVLVQTPSMTDDDREAFLARFAPDNPRTLVAFGVMGGIFSEGIDLKGERLLGVIIVTVGLPLISEERNVISRYYDDVGAGGFEFAYMFPGMNKVLQAAGRVIRTETDRGIILLIDGRFLNASYRDLFPPEWDGYFKTRGTNDIRSRVDTFWEQ